MTDTLLFYMLQVTTFKMFFDAAFNIAKQPLLITEYQ